MKRPKKPGTPIDVRRVRGWATDFEGYRHSVSERHLENWLDQVDPNDKDTIARLLDVVEFVADDQITAAYRQILNSLPGWNKTKSRRKGEWRFAPYSASAGESGDAMLHKFRLATGLSSSQYSELFIHRSDILRAGLGADDTIVLVDDFMGTGNQACKAWNQQFGELLTEVGNIYLVLIRATDGAVQRISEETEMSAVAKTTLTAADNIFHDACKHFSDDDKDTIMRYCQLADHRKPKGYGDCGLVVVFSHNCPNNSIALLHSTADDWEPLFRRYD